MKKIRELRKLCGMTQREFANKYGIPESTIGGIENRDRKTLIETLLNRAVLEDLDEDFPSPPYCLGFNVRRLLDYSHMTQKEFADKYGIPKTQLNNWVTGYQQKPRKYILRLLERFVREDMNEPWKSYINRSKV